MEYKQIDQKRQNRATVPYRHQEATQRREGTNWLWKNAKIQPDTIEDFLSLSVITHQEAPCKLLYPVLCLAK